MAAILDSATAPSGLRPACQAVVLNDFTARIINQVTTTAKTTKFANVPNTPPRQAPSEMRSMLEEYTAKSATPICMAATEKATTHRVVLALIVSNSAQCSNAVQSIPVQGNNADTVFILSQPNRVYVIFGLEPIIRRIPSSLRRPRERERSAMQKSGHSSRRNPVATLFAPTRNIRTTCSRWTRRWYSRHPSPQRNQPETQEAMAEARQALAIFERRSQCRVS